jgi:acylphosphatase
MTASAHIIVTGIVQGVFFRDFTRRRATALGLIGWVCNLRDGRVEALAEGEKEEILRLIADLRQGPPGARVTGLDVEWQLPERGRAEFEIRH